MKKLPGFTLFELLLVIGVMTAFIGVAAALSTQAIKNGEFDRVRETVRSELVAAQSDAIGGTLDSSWGVAFSSSTITRYKGASYATRDTVFDRVATFGNSVVLSGATDVTFSRPAGLPIFPSVIVITEDVLHATATVSAAGVISVQ